jgi:riboflavin kinase/FMN adenylyltransferase
MRRFSNYKEVDGLQATSLAIGNFDGVHVGHRALIDRAQARGKALGVATAVLTFDPHPVRILAPHLGLELICTLGDRLALLAHHGVEITLAQHFDRAFASLEPSAFIQDVLVDALKVRSVVVGYDFGFGSRRSGTLEQLQSAGVEYGFEVHVVQAVSALDGEAASSSRVRKLVSEGDMDTAANVLGRAFHLSGVVVEGEQRGRALGFPTANLDPETELLPRDGVYAGWLDWGESPRPAVVNIGVKPTFGGTTMRSIEAHVIGAENLALYGRRCRLTLRSCLRGEQKFDGPESLEAQITEDVRAAGAYLSQWQAPESW